MKLTIFQAKDGDCLLLQGKGGGQILCDGGRAENMRKVVLPRLLQLCGNQPIDVVYVSHIDSDHISGVLALLTLAGQWKVHALHAGDREVRAPKDPRPPEMLRLWHNSFSAQLSDNDGAVTDLLAAAAPSLLASRSPGLKEDGEKAYGIATSEVEALKVSRLARQFLDIPINTLPGVAGSAKLLLARQANPPITIGSMNLAIVGPSEGALQDLKTEWNEWLEEKKPTLADLDKELKRSINKFAAASPGGKPLNPGLVATSTTSASITVPNLASLVLLVEEDNKTILLTGDASGEDIMRGLRGMRRLERGRLHVDILKVQHHGAAANLDQEFAETITADHYVFCGNGAHSNPELDVIDRVVAARGADANPRPYKFWFSTKAGKGGATKNQDDHMRLVERRVAGHVANSGGRLTVRFNTDVSMEIAL